MRDSILNAVMARQLQRQFCRPDKSDYTLQCSTIITPGVDFGQSNNDPLRSAGIITGANQQ
jgi:hypothetical protein